MEFGSICSTKVSNKNPLTLETMTNIISHSFKPCLDFTADIS